VSLGVGLVCNVVFGSWFQLDTICSLDIVFVIINEFGHTACHGGIKDIYCLQRPCRGGDTPMIQADVVQILVCIGAHSDKGYGSMGRVIDVSPGTAEVSSFAGYGLWH
jgi:hypothetical protein